jgi:hypothetical protein
MFEKIMKAELSFPEQISEVNNVFAAPFLLFLRFIFEIKTKSRTRSC